MLRTLARLRDITRLRDIKETEPIKSDESAVKRQATIPEQMKKRAKLVPKRRKGVRDNKPTEIFMYMRKKGKKNQMEKPPVKVVVPPGLSGRFVAHNAKMIAEGG